VGRVPLWGGPMSKQQQSVQVSPVGRRGAPCGADDDV